MFTNLRRELVVRFGNIGGIGDHRCLFIILEVKFSMHMLYNNLITKLLYSTHTVKHV
jgi:hypothetical protein